MTMCDYNWEIDVDPDSIVCAKGHSYTMLSVSLDEDTGEYIGCVWHQHSSFDEGVVMEEIDNSRYECLDAAKLWCEAMDLIALGNEMMNEIPIVVADYAMNNAEGRNEN